MNHRVKTLAVLALVVAAAANLSNAAADLIIEIPDITVGAGATSYLDVLVRSDSLTSDSFQNYFLDFTLTRSGAATAMNFLESAIPAPQLTATGPDYVLLGESLGEDVQIGIDFVAPLAGPPAADSLITVMDETFSTFERTITSADGAFLLARLNFMAPIGALPGDEYLVELDTTTSVFSDFFLVESATYTPPPGDAAISGTITISAATVPEPSSFAALLTASMCAFAIRRRRRS